VRVCLCVCVYVFGMIPFVRCIFVCMRVSATVCVCVCGECVRMVRLMCMSARASVYECKIECVCVCGDCVCMLCLCVRVCDRERECVFMCACLWVCGCEGNVEIIKK